MNFYKPVLLKAIYIYQDNYFLEYFSSQKCYTLEKKLFCAFWNKIEYSNKPNLTKYVDKKLKQNYELDNFLRSVWNFEQECEQKIEWKFV